jgi:hypothetical protein
LSSFPPRAAGQIAERTLMAAEQLEISNKSFVTAKWPVNSGGKSFPRARTDFDLFQGDGRTMGELNSFARSIVK